MKFKVGDEWFEADASQPIMVLLSEADKRNISMMAPEATKYAMFDDASLLTRDEKLAWMDDPPILQDPPKSA